MRSRRRGQVARAQIIPAMDKGRDKTRYPTAMALATTKNLKRCKIFVWLDQFID